MKEFIFFGTKVKKFVKGTFDDLKSATKIDLHYNDLLTIEDGAFDNSPNMKTLELLGNNLTELPKNLLLKLSLLLLDLSYFSSSLSLVL